MKRTFSIELTKLLKKHNIDAPYKRIQVEVMKLPGKPVIFENKPVGSVQNVSLVKGILTVEANVDNEILDLKLTPTLLALYGWIPIKHRVFKRRKVLTTFGGVTLDESKHNTTSKVS